MLRHQQCLKLILGVEVYCNVPTQINISIQHKLTSPHNIAGIQITKIVRKSFQRRHFAVCTINSFQKLSILVYLVFPFCDSIFSQLFCFSKIVLKIMHQSKNDWYLSLPISRTKAQCVPTTMVTMGANAKVTVQVTVQVTA